MAQMSYEEALAAVTGSEEHALTVAFSILISRSLPDETPMGSTPFPLPGASGNVTAAGAGVLVGFTVRETAGTAAVLRLRDGSGGMILAVISLVAGESVREQLPEVVFSSRVYLELVSGTVEGTVFIR